MDAISRSMSFYRLTKMTYSEDLFEMNTSHTTCNFHNPAFYPIAYFVYKADGL